jgi:hypothetical protein
MTTSRDLDKRAQERATNEGMPESQDRERWKFAGETVDSQKALEAIEAALRALDGLQQALFVGELRSIDIELRRAQQELLSLRKMIENPEAEEK